MNSRQKQQPLDPCDEARGGREPYLTPADDTRSQSPELSRESAVTTYRFTIEGEVTADSAPDAYQAISELFDRMAEAQRSDDLLRFALGDKVRVTLTPASNLTGFVMSQRAPTRAQLPYARWGVLACLHVDHRRDSSAASVSHPRISSSRVVRRSANDAVNADNADKLRRMRMLRSADYGQNQIPCSEFAQMTATACGHAVAAHGATQPGGPPSAGSPRILGSPQ